jgi:Zn-dependent peptidase ImmA (M78 family)
MRDDRKRFVIARAVGDFLRSGESSLVTRSQTEHQQRNRAFAAEFLAPAESLRARIHARRVDEDTVEELAEEFKVSPPVIRYQIQNHRLAELAV